MHSGVLISQTTAVSPFITPYAQRERGKVIGCGVLKKYLNRTLEIDSPFQTFAVGLLV